MDAWLTGAYGLFMHFFGRATPNETWLVIVLCLFFGASALSRVSTGLGAIHAFYTRGLLMTMLGLTLLISAMAVPQVFGLDVYCCLPLATAGAVLFIVVLPVTVLFQKGNYVTALIAWTVTLLTIGSILTLEPMITHAADKFLKEGIGNSKLLENHRIETDRFK